MKQFFQRIWDTAVALNKRNILSSMSKNTNARLLDLGCDSGDWTISLANKIGPRHIAGIEIVREAVEESLNKGINCRKGIYDEDVCSHCGCSPAVETWILQKAIPLAVIENFRFL